MKRIFEILKVKFRWVSLFLLMKIFMHFKEKQNKKK